MVSRAFLKKCWKGYLDTIITKGAIFLQTVYVTYRAMSKTLQCGPSTKQLVSMLSFVPFPVLTHSICISQKTGIFRCIHNKQIHCLCNFKSPVALFGFGPYLWAKDAKSGKRGKHAGANLFPTCANFWSMFT